jgi:ketosteroid isomerase-like protein
MRPVTLLILMALVPTVSSGQGTPSADRTKEELTTLYGRLIEALQRRDTALLGRIYAPDYAFALGGGDSLTTLTRAERLSSIAASTDSISVLNLERCDFKLYGTVAVGECWIRQRNVTGPTHEWAGIYSTVVFRRLATGWRLTRTHASVTRPRR